MSDKRMTFRVSFRKANSVRLRSFLRTDTSEEFAIASARDGFQWAYGYDPGDPVEVERLADEPERTR